MFRSIIACVTKLFSHPADKDPTLSDKNFYHSAAYRYGKRATIVNYAVNPEMFINVSALEWIKSCLTDVNLKFERELNTTSEIELCTHNLVRGISTDEGYHSLLDCTGRKQVEELQQQSCCDDERIKQMKAEHFRVVKDLKEKLEESNAKSLAYCHEIAVLKNRWKAEKEEMKTIKAQYLLTIKDLEDQLQKSKGYNLKYFQKIEINDISSSRKSIIEQSIKFQQIEEIKANKMHVIEKEHHESLKMRKQNKISDLEKCKSKLQELEAKQKEMLEIQKECKLIVEQKKAKVAELREDCERKVHEVKQWKAICALKQHDEKKVNESYKKIMEKVLKDMAKIQVKQKMSIGKPTIVQIKLFGAKDLLICGRDGTSDPYCTFGIIKEENKGMLMKAATSMKEFYITKEYLNQLNCQNSSVAHNTINPIWNEQFELFATNFDSCVLAFEVWDKSENDVVKLRDMKLVMRDINLSDDKCIPCVGGEGDDYMGRAFLAASMIKAEPIEWVLPLYSRSRKRKYGELRVCVNSVTI